MINIFKERRLQDYGHFTISEDDIQIAWALFCDAQNNPNEDKNEPTGEATPAGETLNKVQNVMKTETSEKGPCANQYNKPRDKTQIAVPTVYCARCKKFIPLERVNPEPYLVRFKQQDGQILWAENVKLCPDCGFPLDLLVVAEIWNVESASRINRMFLETPHSINGTFMGESN